MPLRTLDSPWILSPRPSWVLTVFLCRPFTPEHWYFKQSLASRLLSPKTRTLWLPCPMLNSALPAWEGRPVALYHSNHKSLVTINLLLSIITLTTFIDIALHSIGGAFLSLLVITSTLGMDRTGFIHIPIWWKKKLRFWGVKCLAQNMDVGLRSRYLAYKVSAYYYFPPYCVLSTRLSHQDRV